MTKKTDTTIARYRVEEDQNWRDEIKEIPWIIFPAEWMIKIIPPFGDAVVRFLVKLPSGKEKSIYLDSRNSLGYWDGPYWEVYPYQGDTGRCEIKEIDELLKMIGDEENEMPERER